MANGLSTEPQSTRSTPTTRNRSRPSIARRCAPPTFSCSRARRSPTLPWEIPSAGWRRRRLRHPRNAVPHLAVKPQVPGIETNLTIYTTKHLYDLLLRSRGHAMQEVEFYYPDELSTAMKDADAVAAKANQEAVDPPGDSDDTVKVAAVDPAQINFAYTVAGPNVPWKPVRAFDDGSHVYVQMPAGMKSSEAPALLINAGSGTQMVNYRVKGNYYVVDRLFSDAILVAGVGRDEDRVTISYAGATR